MTTREIEAVRILNAAGERLKGLAASLGTDVSDVIDSLSYADASTVLACQAIRQSRSPGTSRLDLGSAQK